MINKQSLEDLFEQSIVRVERSIDLIQLCYAIRLGSSFFVRPSAMLLELLANPISEMIFSLYSCSGEAIPNLILFSELRDALEMKPKRDLLSVNSCTGT